MTTLFYTAEKTDDIRNKIQDSDVQTSVTEFIYSSDHHGLGYSTLPSTMEFVFLKPGTAGWVLQPSNVQGS